MNALNVACNVQTRRGTARVARAHATRVATGNGRARGRGIVRDTKGERPAIAVGGCSGTAPEAKQGASERAPGPQDKPRVRGEVGDLRLARRRPAAPGDGHVPDGRRPDVAGLVGGREADGVRRVVVQLER